MSYASLEKTDFRRANMEEAKLEGALLEEANLVEATLQSSDLRGAHLERANFAEANLVGSNLHGGHLEGTNFRGANLEGADLRSAFFDASTILDQAKLKYIYVADAHWNDVTLSGVDWSQVKILGDELDARLNRTFTGKIKDKSNQFSYLHAAVRANRQFSNILQNQGINEYSAHFAYRAQKFQRVVLLRQGKFGPYLFSVFLDLLAGYGY